MKFNKRWLCAFLSFCLLLGMVPLGVAEDELLIGLPEDESLVDAGLDGLDEVEDLILEDDGLGLDLDDGLSIANDLALNVDDAESEDPAGDADSGDFEIDENGVLVRYLGQGGEVVVPDGVTAIGEGAFSYCSELVIITIPDSVVTIGDSAFSSCWNLMSVNLGNGLTSIGRNAFRFCQTLDAITIPDSVVTIGDSAFDNCSGMKAVTIGKGVTDIGEHTFSACYHLEKIDVSKDNGAYTSRDGVLYTHDVKTLLRCPQSHGSVTIPSGVATIADKAFYQCGGIKRIDVVDSVTVIGKLAFSNCANLKTVNLGKGVSSLGINAFTNCRSLNAINVSKKNEAFSSSDGVLYSKDMKTLLICPQAKTGVTVPDSVVAIADGDDPSDQPTYGGFAGCEALKTVKLPANLEYIGKFAFYDCSSLTSITVPRKVRQILTGTFQYCKALQKVTLPAGLTLIDYKAFYRCESLKRISIPQTVEKIEWNAFTYCSSLENVTIPDSVTSIGECAFLECTGLKSAVIGNGVKSIGNEAFEHCDKLQSVTIPRSVTKIGNNAFHTRNDDGNIIPLNVTISGYKGSYAETYAKKEGFRFTRLPDPVSIAKAKLTVPAQVYTGKALKPAVKVVLKGKTLKKDTDYTVTYAKNKAIGTATVTVKGKGDYAGTAKATFKINPKAVTGLKLASGREKLTAGWKKSAGGVSGYQLQYALKKSFSGGKKVTVPKAGTLKRTLQGLKTGKIYYVRVRAYKKVGSKVYWSSWSAVKRAKVK